jgi:hypothetical protein
MGVFENLFDGITAENRAVKAHLQNKKKNSI